jgi:hypothetical protein
MASAHDFDFWIGDWDIFGPEGKHLGTNTITSMFGNGMLHEHWHGNAGLEGRSMNAFDEPRGVWHQTWMDSSGGVLLIEGGLRDGAMVMVGTAPSNDDPSRLDRQRITWTHDGDELRQLWETSPDEGKTWEVAFDGRYRRRTTR